MAFKPFLQQLVSFWGGHILIILTWAQTLT
jgi:hypothetical protein